MTLRSEFPWPFCRLPGKTTPNVSDCVVLSIFGCTIVEARGWRRQSVLKLLLIAARGFDKWKSSKIGGNAFGTPTAPRNLHLRIRNSDDGNRRCGVTQSSDCKPSVVTEKNTQRADVVSVYLWNRCRQWKERKKTFFIAFRRYASRFKGKLSWGARLWFRFGEKTINVWLALVYGEECVLPSFISSNDGGCHDLR